jgi:excinuclease ABC subunit C
MGQCLGACFQEVPEEKYQHQITRIKSFLNGNTGTIKKRLTDEMQQGRN